MKEVSLKRQHAVYIKYRKKHSYRISENISIGENEGKGLKKLKKRKFETKTILCNNLVMGI